MPKAAAKILVREAGGIKLSFAQEAIAKATGHRDWHELTASADGKIVSASPDLPTAKTMVLSIADRLGVSHGDVEFALTRSRLLPDMPLQDGLRLRTSIWRDRLFGPPGRGRPGTVIRVKEPGSVRPGYLLSLGRPAHIFYDSGFGICADFEVVTPRVPLDDFAPSRLWLPYGYWTVSDGAIVTFSRDYKPMWRTADGVSTRLDPWLRIPDIRQEAHFSTMAGTIPWSRGPARELALEHLNNHRIVGLPRLLDAMEHALDPTVESVSNAVARMRRASEALVA
ncbi:MAG: hypothetical protein V4610_15435 [Pseudomonadota bacterium]